MKKRKGALLLSVMLLFLGIFSAAGASAHTAAAGTSQNTERTTAHSRVSEQESENTDMAVHFLDVGQGLSILVQSGGQNLLYDGGDRSASSFVVSYLKKQNVETIDYLIASHYDSDHISGLVGCLNAFEYTALSRRQSPKKACASATQSPAIPILSEPEASRSWHRKRPAPMTMTIPLSSAWKTEIPVFFSPEMQRQTARRPCASPIHCHFLGFSPGNRSGVRCDQLRNRQFLRTSP